MCNFYKIKVLNSYVQFLAICNNAVEKNTSIVKKDTFAVSLNFENFPLI